jgi:hypothetical protein
MGDRKDRRCVSGDIKSGSAASLAGGLFMWRGERAWIAVGRAEEVGSST